MSSRIAAGIFLGFTAAAAVRAVEAPTGTIVGHVVDRSTRLGLPFSNVVVAGTSTGAGSREEGRFVIQRVPSGEHRITATLAGYHPDFEWISVAGGETTSVEIVLARHDRAPDHSGTFVPRVCDPVTLPLSANADSLVRVRVSSACSVLGLEYPFQLRDWRFYNGGGSGATLLDSRGEKCPFAYDGRIRAGAVGGSLKPPEPRCLYIGALEIDQEAARRLPVGSEEERAFLDALHVWADEQIPPSRRDSLHALAYDETTPPELRQDVLFGHGDSQRNALFLTGILRALELQRVDWMKLRTVTEPENR